MEVFLTTNIVSNHSPAFAYYIIGTTKEREEKIEEGGREMAKRVNENWNSRKTVSFIVIVL